MLELTCHCGAVIELSESFIGTLCDCPTCKRPLRIVATGPLESGVSARLSIVDGPVRIREQFFLAGQQSIEVGKLPDKSISLTGTLVSRNHCRFNHGAGGWTLEDLKSTNGVYLNNKRITAALLRDGDIVKIGEYELRYESTTAVAPTIADAPIEVAVPFVDLAVKESYEEIPVIAIPKKASPARKPVDAVPDDDYGAYEIADADRVAVKQSGNILPTAPAHIASHKSSPTVSPGYQGKGIACPCCGLNLAPNAKICVTCGIKIPSGRPMATSRGMDENDLYERTNLWVTVVSLFVPINLIPVASEAFGVKRARSVWAILGITFVFSTVFLVANWSDDNSQFSNLMLWCGSSDQLKVKIDAKRHELEQLKPKGTRGAQWAHGASKKPAKPVVTVPAESDDPDSIPTEELNPKEYQKLLEEFDKEAALLQSNRFEIYQLITTALLHGGILHFVGNMVFLLVFGLRVNEALGDLIFPIVYPALAILASAIYFISASGQALHPALGASGAIMGLAGMYFVFYPVQHVHMAFWFRMGWLFKPYLKMFRVRGFWLLVLWVGFNDILPMVLARKNGEVSDGVAHWAHLGGFIAGMVIAVALLALRLTTARGADLISYILGKYAWPLIGKPNANIEAPIASAGRSRPTISAYPK